MRVDTRPRHRNAPRPAGKSAPGFLQWLRGRPCIVDNPNCEGKIEAAHTYGSGDKGMGTKSSDRFAVPLCARHHKEQHDIGWLSFEVRHRLGCASTIASAYWRAWPGRIAWERKQNSA